MDTMMTLDGALRLHLHVMSSRRTWVVRARGELDLATFALLGPTLDGLPRDAKVVLDLGATSFVAIAVLGRLVGARDRLRAGGGDLLVRNLEPKVEDIVRRAGVESLLRWDRSTPAS